MVLDGADGSPSWVMSLPSGDRVEQPPGVPEDSGQVGIVTVFTEDARQGTEGLGRIDGVEHESGGAQCDRRGGSPSAEGMAVAGAAGVVEHDVWGRGRSVPSRSSPAGQSEDPLAGLAGSRLTAAPRTRRWSPERGRAGDRPAMRPSRAPAATTTPVRPAGLQLARSEVEAEGADCGGASAGRHVGRAAVPGELGRDALDARVDRCPVGVARPP